VLYHSTRDSGFPCDSGFLCDSGFPCDSDFPCGSGFSYATSRDGRHMFLMQRTLPCQILSVMCLQARRTQPMFD
jgi:hypothetical protein